MSKLLVYKNQNNPMSGKKKNLVCPATEKKLRFKVPFFGRAGTELQLQHGMTMAQRLDSQPTLNGGSSFFNLVRAGSMHNLERPEPFPVRVNRIKSNQLKNHLVSFFLLPYQLRSN